MRGLALHCAFVVASVLGLASCVQADLVPCGDLVCSAGSRCLDGVLCASDSQVQACEGRVDGTECTWESSTGYCVHGACTANTCGDGIVTGNEVCDGDEVTLTCGDLGYYHGDLRCTEGCSIDRTECSGRCGDDIVDSADGEECDGGHPLETCVDEGRDYGYLGCNRFCTPAITSDCRRYGFAHLLDNDGNDITRASVSNAGVIALANRVRVVWKGAGSELPKHDDWSWTAAGKDRLVVGGPNDLSWFDGTWHDVTAGVPGGAETSVADDGTLIGINVTSCAIGRVDLPTGAADTPSAPPSTTICRSPVAYSHDDLYVIGSGKLWHWRGAWMEIALPAGQTGVSDLSRTSDGNLLVVSQKRMTYNVSAGTFGPLSPRLTALMYDEDDNDLDFLSTESGPNVVGFGTAGIGYFDAFAENQHSIGHRNEGGLFAYGAGVVEIRPTWSRVSPLVWSDIQVVDNRVTACDTTATLFADDVFHTPPDPCRDMLGSPAGDHLVSTDREVYHWSGTAYVREVVYPITDLSGTVDDAWGLARLQAQVAHRVSGTWTLLPIPGCSAVGVAGDSSHGVYATADCGTAQRVYRYDAGTWTSVVELVVQPRMDLITMAPDGTVFFRLADNVHGTHDWRRLDGTIPTTVGGSALLFAVSHDEWFEAGKTTLAHRFPDGHVVPFRAPFTENIVQIIATPTALYARLDKGVYVLNRMSSRFAVDGM